MKVVNSEWKEGISRETVIREWKEGEGNRDSHTRMEGGGR